MFPPPWALAVMLRSLLQEGWLITLTQIDRGNLGAFY